MRLVNSTPIAKVGDGTKQRRLLPLASGAASLDAVKALPALHFAVTEAVRASAMNETAAAVAVDWSSS